jgi:endonuclease III
MMVVSKVKNRLYPKIEMMLLFATWATFARFCTYACCADAPLSHATIIAQLCPHRQAWSMRVVQEFHAQGDREIQ